MYPEYGPQSILTVRHRHNAGGRQFASGRLFRQGMSTNCNQQRTECARRAQRVVQSRIYVLKKCAETETQMIMRYLGDQRSISAIICCHLSSNCESSAIQYYAQEVRKLFYADALRVAALFRYACTTNCSILYKFVSDVLMGPGFIYSPCFHHHCHALTDNAFQNL